MSIKKYHDIVNYGTIVIIAILLVLVFFKLVPENWFFTILIISLVLLVIRIVTRAYFIYKSKKMKNGG